MRRNRRQSWSLVSDGWGGRFFYLYGRPTQRRAGRWRSLASEQATVAVLGVRQVVGSRFFISYGHPEKRKPGGTVRLSEVSEDLVSKEARSLDYGCRHKYLCAPQRAIGFLASHALD